MTGNFFLVSISVFQKLCLYQSLGSLLFPNILPLGSRAWGWGGLGSGNRTASCSHQVTQGPERAGAKAWRRPLPSCPGRPFPCRLPHALKCQASPPPAPVLGGSASAWAGAPRPPPPTAPSSRGITSCPKESISGTGAHPVIYSCFRSRRGCQGHVEGQRKHLASLGPPGADRPLSLGLPASRVEQSPGVLGPRGQHLCPSHLQNRFPEALMTSRPLFNDGVRWLPLLGFTGRLLAGTPRTGWVES